MAKESTSPTVSEPARMDIIRAVPELYRAMAALSRTVAESGLERPLLELVRIRASQINGCAFCIDMHTADAREAGETEQRIYGLSAWRETPFFTARERAALALTEAVTLVADTRVPDDVYEKAAKEFDEQELAKLIWAISEINSWNRVTISARMVPGSHRPSR
ncbi:carboxymuconolactone decarboxylase family protein [Microtetraspora niveoalba]|uniref:carboxymuconolactone decarboxylase family protein n=1 Tax=Microtetraspora niveoalba TaxID=46175 RepID=UPI000831A907|nr:carboxymuconolactone decarboxylase family protein [Microtetraspora niveoalba]